MANTFISLSDTPSVYSGSTQVVITAGSEIDFITFSTNELSDVNTFGAYAPENGQVLTYFGGVNEWRPALSDPYSAGNGLNKTDQGVINITTSPSGGLLANSTGIFIEPVSTAGTYGNATHIPSITINDKGQVISTALVEGTFEIAQSLNAEHIANISGTAGQISVTGGSGIASSPTLNLVSTGVTPGTYGNVTHAPQITVDTYGRIQNVDLVLMAGGAGGNGNVDYNIITTEAYRNIEVAGQTTVSADNKADTLTFAAGTGMTITTNAAADTITFASAAGGASVDVDDTPPLSPSEGDLWWDSAAGRLKIYYTDVDSSQWVDTNPAGSAGGGASVTVSDNPPSGPSDGDLWWNSNKGRLKIYYQDVDSVQWVDASPTTGLTDVANLTDGELIVPQSNTVISSGEGSVTWNYTTDTLHVGTGDAGFVTLADLDDLDLAWDEANATLSIAGGNSIALTGLGGSYGDADVLLLGEGNWAGNIIPSANVTYDLGTNDARWKDLYLANATIYLGTDTISTSGAGLLLNGNAIVSYTDASVQAYLDAQGFSNTATTYGDTDVQTYLDAQGYSNVDLDAQTLTWDEANSNISISGGNEVTITGFSNYADSDVNTFLTSNGYSNTVVSYSNATVQAYLDTQGYSNTVVSYSNATVQAYLDTQGYSNVDSDSQTLTWDQANSNLSISGGNTVTISFAGGTFSASSLETGNVQPAAETTDSVNGDNLNINGGDASGLNSTGGTLILDAGTGAVANGQVDIGTSNATQIDIGNGTSTTIIAGSVNTLGTFRSQGDALFDTGVQEAFSTINAATGTVTHDCDNGHIFRHTAPVADFTANFTNFGLTTDYAATVTLVIDQGATARIPTAVQIGGVAQTLLWQGGSPPTGTNNGEDVVSFSFLKTGVSTYTVLGQLVGFS